MSWDSYVALFSGFAAGLFVFRGVNARIWRGRWFWSLWFGLFCLSILLPGLVREAHLAFDKLIFNFVMGVTSGMMGARFEKRRAG